MQDVSRIGATNSEVLPDPEERSDDQWHQRTTAGTREPVWFISSHLFDGLTVTFYYCKGSAD